MSQLLQSLSRALDNISKIDSGRVVKMTAPEVISHAMHEVRWFVAHKSEAGAGARIRALVTPTKQAAEWLKGQEEALQKALQWEDTASQTFDVMVYVDEAQLKAQMSGPIDPRDNNAMPPGNQFSNAANFTAAMKSLFTELQSALKAEVPAATPAPVAPAAPTPTPAAPAAPEVTTKADNSQAGPNFDSISWPLDMAHRDYLKGGKAPEQRNDFGEDRRSK